MRYLFFILSLLPFSLSANNVQEFKLDNGLKLIVKEDHRAPIVVSQVWYKIGSSYEPEGMTGISHLLEHMMFKGTKKYPAGRFSQIMAENGAQENAFTGQDYTAYFQTIEKSRLALSFEMESDRMRSLLLQQAEFEKEKQVVLEERRMRTDDEPNSVLDEYFQATAYQTSGYQHPIIGWASDIDSIVLEDLQTWYSRWYAPNNAIVVVVGDVEPQAVLELAKRYFGPIKPSVLTPPKPRLEVEQLGIKRLVVKRPAKLPYLLMGYKAPSLATINRDKQWETYALEVLAQVLSSNDSARLYKNLVRGQQTATSVNAYYSFFDRLTSLFMFSVVPAEGHTVAELETAIRAQIEQLKTQLVDKVELERVKNQLTASKVYELDSAFYQGMQIGLLETVGLNWQLTDTYLQEIAKVTPEQIQAVAKKYLIDDGLTVGILEPQPLPSP